MDAPQVRCAVAAAMSAASELDLTADDATVLHNSDKLALRLTPCDVFVRVAPVSRQIAAFEIELAQRLAETDSPVMALDPRVEPQVYQRGGFAMTFWRYYEPLPASDVTPADYADALRRLHQGMRLLDMPTPHLTERVAGAQQTVDAADHVPGLDDADIDLLGTTLRTAHRSVVDRGAAEQPLHGEPHPGNILSTAEGLVFVDLETCCRGPVEFDIAHTALTRDDYGADIRVSDEVTAHYPGADRELVRDCHILMLALVAAWRCHPDDRLPNKERAARQFLSALRRALGRPS